MGVNDYRIQVVTTLSDAEVSSIADEVMLTKPPRFGPEGWRAKFTWQASPPEPGTLRAYRLRSAGAVAEMMAAKTVRVQNSLMEIWTEEADGRRTVTVAGASPAVNFGTNMGFMVFPRYLTLFEQRLGSSEASPSETDPSQSDHDGDASGTDIPSQSDHDGDASGTDIPSQTDPGGDASGTAASTSISARNEAARKAPPRTQQAAAPARERTATYPLVAKVRSAEVSQNPFLPQVTVGDTVQLVAGPDDGERFDVSTVRAVEFGVENGDDLEIVTSERELPLSLIETDSRLVVLSGLRRSPRMFTARREAQNTITIGQIALSWIGSIALVQAGPSKAEVSIGCAHVCDGDLIKNTLTVALLDEASARGLTDRLVRRVAQARLATATLPEADRPILEDGATAGIEASRTEPGPNTWEWTLPGATPWCWRTTFADDTKVSQANDGHWSAIGRLGPRFTGSSAFPDVVVRPSGSRLVHGDQAATLGATSWPATGAASLHKVLPTSAILDRARVRRTGELFVTPEHVVAIFPPDPRIALGAPSDGVGLRADVASFPISWIHTLHTCRTEGEQAILVQGVLEQWSGAEFLCEMLIDLPGVDVDRVAQEILKAIMDERRAGSAASEANGQSRYNCSEEDFDLWRQPRESPDEQVHIWKFGAWMTVHER